MQADAATPILFCGTLGCRQDSSATRSDMEHRVLDMVKGKWMTEDIVRFMVGLESLYCYVRNNPTGIVDRHGLSPCPKRHFGWCWECEYHRLWIGGGLKEGCAAASRLCGGTPCGVDCNDPPLPFPVHPPISPPKRGPLTPGGGAQIPHFTPKKGFVGDTCARFFCNNTYDPGGDFYGLCKWLAGRFANRTCQALLEECRSTGSELLK